MSIKISFLHYMRWIRVMLPDVFEEFEVVYVFLATFCFSLSLSIGKRSTLGKIRNTSPPHPDFYGPAKKSFTSNFKIARKKRFFRRSNFQLIPICYYVNKRILFQLINKSLVVSLVAI